MRISDWSSDVCSSDLGGEHVVEIERGVQLFFGLEAIGDADDKGMRTVMTTLNGQLRPVFVRDRSIAVETRSAERADRSETRREGKEWVRTWRSRLSPYHYKKNYIVTLK